MAAYTEILKEWQKHNINTAEDLDFYLDNFRILFAYNSNHIENPETTYHDTREIFENGKLSSFTGDLRTIYEIDNQRICYEYLKDKIIAKQPLTQELIKEIHYKLMRGCYDQKRYDKGERPGTYKIHDYIVGDDVGVAADEVESEIQFVLDEVYSNESANPLTVASYLHLSLESIHPFADGNGRLGRTLMNYYLITHNHPPIVIYSEDKRDYYLALAVFDKTGKISGFEQFLKEQTVKTWTRKAQIRHRLNNRYVYCEITKDEADYLISKNIKFDGKIESDKLNIIRFNEDDKQKVDEALNNFKVQQKREI